MPNPSRKSKTYTKQSKFQGSNRQVRGMVLRLLSQQDSYTDQEMSIALGEYSSKSEPIIQQLIKEGFVAYDAGQLSLPKN